MADNLKDRGPRDASRIDVSQEHELRYWTKRFGVSDEELKATVKKVGVIVDDVEKELKGSASVGQASG